MAIMFERSVSRWRRVGIGLLVAVALAMLAWRYQASQLGHNTSAVVPAAAAGKQAATMGGQMLAGASQGAGRMPSGMGSFGEPSPLDTVKPPRFRADAAGRLVIDARARLDIEQVYGLYQGPQVLSKLQAFSEHLPAQAQQDLRNLYQRYVQYDAALTQSQAASASGEEATLETAERELETLKELRRTYFGPEMAKAMYEQEEQSSRDMLDYMRHHTDPNLPLAQRAELAQGVWAERLRQASSASSATP